MEGRRCHQLSVLVSVLSCSTKIRYEWVNNSRSVSLFSILHLALGTYVFTFAATFMSSVIVGIIKRNKSDDVAVKLYYVK